MEESDLIGSEKQIAWAEDLRRYASEALEPLRRGIIASPDSEVRAIALEIIDGVLQEKDASRWIENCGIMYSRAWLSRKVKERLAEK